MRVLANDKGEIGGSLEDYNRNWEFQSILLKLHEREFSGKIAMYKNGFTWVSDTYEQPIYNPTITITDDIARLIFPKIPEFGTKFPSMGNDTLFIFYNPARMVDKFEPKVENVGFRLFPYYLGNLGKMNMEPCLYRGGFQ